MDPIVICDCGRILTPTYLGVTLREFTCATCGRKHELPPPEPR